ncbi:MAG TPA: ABC transporter permease [Acetobacteraceae bacterium]|nr:ABC transporter permease [Acetobacteraceae bacterium]
MNIAAYDSPTPASGTIVLEFRPSMAAGQRSRLAAADIADGARLWRLAWTLGWLDIRLRYRGSLLGPFWLTLSTAVMVASLGFLYAALFHMDLREYLPFIALSQVLWTFIAGVVTEGCTCFTQAEGIIRSVRMPLFVHAVRTVVRNLLVLAHNVVVIVVVFAALAVHPGWAALWALPGLAVWLVVGAAVCLPLGAICARFRDIPPIVGSVMQIAFFVTPIIWLPAQLGAARQHWLLLNPFFDLIEIVRAPLLGTVAGSHVWVAALVIMVVTCAVSWLLFTRVRGRIAFWI